MENLSFATRWNVDEVDSNYIKWLKEPASLNASWRIFFEGFHLGSDQAEAPANNGTPPKEVAKSAPSVTEDAIEKHARLYGAIYSFRDIGHTQGTFDPLKEMVEENPRLSLEPVSYTHLTLPTILLV